MATFRSGFKIFGELTLRQSLGRIRSYSEDRKPGLWQPEDQWAVRPPCSTCPDPSAPKKPKVTKSWLSMCRDPRPPLTCDVRHNNCPPPKTDDEPWYAFITKKKPEKPKPPLNACRAELQRQAEMPDEEETCDNLGDTGWPEYSPPCLPCPPVESVCKERQPASVIRLSCPPPKELDLMLWCGRPGLSVARIASQCQSDKLPYEEFRPRKCWKPPPYSLPCKSEAPAHQPFCCNVGRAPLSEYKQVEIPKPVYTRYKSVELEDENFLLYMTDARCPPDNCGPSLALEPPPIKKAKPPPEKPKPAPCPEKPVLVAASRKPVKLRCAPKFTFRPKPTKLVERRHFRNPCAQHNACNLTTTKPPEEEKPYQHCYSPPCSGEPSKVITSNITDEPPTYQRSIPSKKPPLWMFVMSKPGSNDTPLVPHLVRYPKEPDWCGETDGLKFYDDQNDGLCPKPPPDPCKECPEQPSPPPPCPPKSQPKIKTPSGEDEKFVLMPDKYNIRNSRPPEGNTKKDLSQATFQQFIDAKTANIKKCSKLYPQMKESILYDFVRNCPLPPLDPSKPDPPPRRPPDPECPQPTRFYYRRYSTFTPFRKPNLKKYEIRMRTGDSREKCKARKLVPKPKECGTQVKGPSCDEMTLPGCPKAKVPPRCGGKKVMPPCKKRLAPKPSYSECSKEPAPCPKITECNAWEKRDMENDRKSSTKGRKFSSWASDEAYVRDSQNPKSESAAVLPTLTQNPTAPQPSYSEYLDVRVGGQSPTDRKGISHKQRRVLPGKELMPNPVNPAEGSTSYYTSESLVQVRKPQPWKKSKTVQLEEKNMESSESSQLQERRIITLLLQDHHTRNDARIKNLRVTHRESGLGVYVDNTFPRDLFGYIGNWITRFLKPQRKRPESAPASLNTNDRSLRKTCVETVDVERIMKLTKPLSYRMKAKGQPLGYCTIDPLGGHRPTSKVPLPRKRLWGRQWNKSLVLFPKLNKERARSSMWKFESLSPTVEMNPEKEESDIRNKTRDVKLLPAPEGTAGQKPSRLPVWKPEEHSLRAVETLGSRTVLVNRYRENQLSGAGQVPGKNGFRWYIAPVMQCQIDDEKGVGALPKEIGTSLFLKKKPSKKKVAIKSKSQSAKSMKSGTQAFTPCVLLAQESVPGRVRRYSKSVKNQTSDEAIVPITLRGKPWFYITDSTKIGPRKTISSITFVKDKPQKRLEGFNFYRRKWKKDKKKLNGNILADDLKHPTRNEVKDVLSKLDVRNRPLTISETAVRTPQKEGTNKEMWNKCEGGCRARVPDKRIGRFSWQHAYFRRSGKGAQSGVIEVSDDIEVTISFLAGRDMRSANATRLLNTSLSSDNIPRELSNNLVLDDAGSGIVHYDAGTDSQKQIGKTNLGKIQKQTKGRNKPVTATSYGKVPLTTLSIANSRMTVEQGSSSPCKAGILPRRYARASGKPSDQSFTRGWKESDPCEKLKKDKPKDIRKDVKKDDETENCWKKLIPKKPGPKCPDD